MARAALLAATLAPFGAAAQEGAPFRIDRGRFTIVGFPQDAPLVTSLAASAIANDTFPGLPRPSQRVLIAIAPDEARFRAWIGPAAPEWGAAVAFPGERRIVMQGRRAGSDAGDPISVLRHELAHLALHEAMGDLPPRWFDEGYASFAAAETGRDQVLSTNVALVFRGVPSLDSLDAWFYQGAARADAGYALAHRAVAELANLDQARGLTLFFQYWKERGTLDAAVRAAYGLTLAGFEERWRKTMRRRYGGLALIADLAVVGAIVLAMLLPLYITRRRRDRARMEQLRAADRAAEAAAAAGVLAQMLGEEQAEDLTPRPAANAEGEAP